MDALECRDAVDTRFTGNVRVCVFGISAKLRFSTISCRQVQNYHLILLAQLGTTRRRVNLIT